ncbi:MAG: GNAT family N-acetyltransferase, partial [Thermomicrobiales bacterium]
MSRRRGAGSAGLTIMVGDHIYLRPPVAADAARVMTWRELPWPLSTAGAETWLKKEIPKTYDRGQWRLIACQVEDDLPVGSALIDELVDAPSALLRLHAAPMLTGQRRQQVLSESLRLIVAWLGMERGAMAISVDLESDDTDVIETAETIGMRRAFRLREGFWRDGAHHDWVSMQWLNPGWIERIGDPGPGIALEREPVAAPKSPAPLRWPESNLPLPNNAIIASERLALRPFEPGDEEPIARSFIEEPDNDFGHSRLPISPLALGAWHAESETNEPPHDVEFAIVLRETGEVIGENGIYYADWLSRTAETGTWIYRPAHRGGGLGTEAKHLLLEWAFQRAGLTMVWSWDFEGNDR